MAATVVVVGAGPGGIAASCAAAESGAQTLLLDENPAPGGQIWRSGVAAPPREARSWLERLASSAARIEHGASVFDIGESSLWVERDGQAVEVTYERLVLATGARELFLPFPGWTLPEVMGIGGIQALVKAGADIAGRRVVIAGSGPLILPVASTLNGKGSAAPGRRRAGGGGSRPGLRPRALEKSLEALPSGKAAGFVPRNPLPHRDMGGRGAWRRSSREGDPHRRPQHPHRPMRPAGDLLRVGRQPGASQTAGL